MVSFYRFMHKCTVVCLHQVGAYRSHDFLAADNLLGKEPRARAMEGSETKILISENM